MADEKFKLPQSSYEELAKIIRGYGHIGEAADLTQVSKVSALHPTVVSRNAGFLVAVGILETGARKAVTSLGNDLARALDHEMPDEIRRCWQSVVVGSDFLSKLVAAVRIRNGMDPQTLEAHVAYSAGQPKKPGFMTGARTVIDILKAAEVIREADGKYIAVAPDSLAEPVSVGSAGGVATVRGVGAVRVPATHERTPRLALLRQVSPTQQINININVSCSPNDLDELGQKLRTLLRQLEEDADNESGKPQ